MIASTPPPIGIDLGSTYSRIGVLIDGRLKLITDDQGQKYIPSVVFLGDDEHLVGRLAKQQATSNLTNTIFDIKRLIGRIFNEPSVQKDIKQWPFVVEAGRDGKPLISILDKGKERRVTPEEILSMLFKEIKKEAESYLNCTIKDAVITVPEYFNDPQRQIMKDCAASVGFNVLQIIREPVVAAIAYKLDKIGGQERNILVFNLGGRTLNVSLLVFEDGIFELRGTGNDLYLGGGDFDNKIVEYCAAEFTKKTGLDIRNNPIAMQRLRIQCERAKRILSVSAQACIEVESIHESISYSCVLTREKFEELCLPLFDLVIPVIERVFADAQISKNEIHDVVLAGGSTRIPKILELLHDFFGGRELLKSINLDEAIAIGAGTIASISQEDTMNATRDIIGLSIELTQLSLGIEAVGGVMLPIITRHRSIPVSKSYTFGVRASPQHNLILHIVEGERLMAKDNRSLGQLDLRDIPLSSQTHYIIVTFNIDINKALKVTVVDELTGVSTSFTVPREEIPDDDIGRLIKEAEEYKEEDVLQQRRALERAKLEKSYGVVQIADDDGVLINIFDLNKAEAVDQNRAEANEVD